MLTHYQIQVFSDRFGGKEKFDIISRKAHLLMELH